MRRVMSLLVLVLLLNPTLALPAPDSNVWSDHERGWFWYEVMPEELPEEPVAPQQVPPPEVAIPKARKPEGPPVLSAEWIRENLEKYRLWAIDDPTPENVAAYLYIQRVMLDKSQRFSEQVKHVVQLDPLLDQGTRRPLASYGGAQFSKEVMQERQRLLAQVAQQAGIFFFLQGSCGHCEVQAPVLKSLEERYGFVVFPVSIDGRPLKSNLFPHYVVDRGQARHLQVFQTPAMFLGKPNTRAIIPLGQTTLSRDQLEDRILLAARDAGWITPEDYNRTRGFNASLALDLKPDSIPGDLNRQDLVGYVKKLYSERLGSGGAKACGECQAKSDFKEGK